MQKLNEIKELLRAARIRTLSADYAKTIAGSPSIDKHSLSFDGDSRFAVFSTTVTLECYTGHYGNSSCSTFMSIDSKLARQALNHYLNKNMKDVLAGMADYLEAKAAKLVDQAEKELADQQAILDSIKHPNQASTKQEPSK